MKTEQELTSYPGMEYQKLFDHLHDAHGLSLTQCEMDEIIRISLLTKQEEQFKPCGEWENICNCKSESECGYLEQPQANDVGKFPKSTWEVDALRRKVKRFEEEIQSIKQANAELMEKAKSEAIKWRKLGDNSIMRDECITKANVWEEIVAYLQQND